MITKDMTIRETIQKNHQAQQVFLSFRIGASIIGSDEDQTIEEACIEHGINLEQLLKELNYNRYY